MSTLLKPTYEANQITLNRNGQVYCNATKMTKDFGQQLPDWLNLKSTTNFLDVTSKEINITLEDLLIVENVGNTETTWMQEDVALELFRCLFNSVLGLPFLNSNHE